MREDARFFEMRVSILEGLLGINRMGWACTYTRGLFARKARANITKAINDNSLATRRTPAICQTAITMDIALFTTLFEAD